MHDEPLDPILYTGKPEFLSRFVVELTNHCNLRCRYCHQNAAFFKPNNPISEENFAEIFSFVRNNSIKHIDLVGGGDILMYPSWAEKCRLLLDAGIRLSTTINLGKILEDDEVDVLAEFGEITVSIDTLDRKILANVRKAVDIRTIVYNMMRIKAATMKKEKKVNWIISAVYSAEVVNRLPELALFAAAFGAMAYQIQDIMIFNDIPNNVMPVWELQGEEALKAVAATKESITIANSHGLHTHMPPDFVKRLDAFAKKQKTMKKVA